MAFSQTKAGMENFGYIPDSELNDYKNGGSSKKDQQVVSIDDNRAPPYKKKPYDEEEKEEEDPWKVTSLKMDYVPWQELSTTGQIIRAVLYVVKIVFVIGFLYLFICSLDFLSSAFKLLGGKKAGEIFQSQEILVNPVAGLMMGVLVTVLVQSSSTSTSIVISMVGAQILDIQTAIPIVMGANIGTSVTNTIVALGQITDKGDFRRAFAGATVHDMFNWLSVLVLLPIEVATHYLYYLSTAIVNSMHLEDSLDLDQDFLKKITKPFTSLIIQVSTSGIKKIATKEGSAADQTLLKLCCDTEKPKDCCEDRLEDLETEGLYGGITNYTRLEKARVCMTVDECVLKEHTEENVPDGCLTKPWKTEEEIKKDMTFMTLDCATLGGNSTEMDCCRAEVSNSTFYMDRMNATSFQIGDLCTSVNSTCYSTRDVYSTCAASSSWVNTTLEKIGVGETFSCSDWTKKVERDCNEPCEYLFKPLHDDHGLKDEEVGGILLVIALILLCVCLVAIVKLLHSLLQGPMAKAIKKFVNADFPGRCSYFTGYLAILLGAGFTILVQSSSIFTSTLTPLVGIGVIELERMYPLTLGSNIGTTATGILAALSQDAKDIPRSLTVAFCHLFFNITGIVIFYPLPFFRPPIPAAKFLGNTTAKYRWFAIVYLICMFFLFPLAVFGLSLIKWWVLAIVLIPIALLLIIVGIIKIIQHKKQEALPPKLQNWKFLPQPLRSLEPYDSCMGKLCFCKRFQRAEGDEPKNRTTPNNTADLYAYENGGQDTANGTTTLNTRL